MNRKPTKEEIAAKEQGWISLKELMAYLGVSRQCAKQFGDRYGDVRNIGGKWFYDAAKIREAMGDKAGKPLTKKAITKLPAYYFIVTAIKKGTLHAEAKTLGPVVSATDPSLTRIINSYFPAKSWIIVLKKRVSPKQLGLKREDIREVKV